MNEFKHWKDELPEPERPLLYWIGYVKDGKIADSDYSTGRYFEQYEDQPAGFMDWQANDRNGDCSFYQILHSDSEYLYDKDDPKYFIDIWWKYAEESYGTNPYGMDTFGRNS